MEKNNKKRLFEIFEYGDEKSFYNKAKKIWNQEPPTSQGGSDNEAPFLRGREPES